jgi:hypothetical protein
LPHRAFVNSTTGEIRTPTPHARRALRAHGHEVPPDEPVDVTPPADVETACRAGAESERRNIALYDELMQVELPPDVHCVFEHLQAMSRARHLPAFTRCAGAAK